VRLRPVLAALGAVFAACAGEADPSTEEPMVVTTVSPITSIVANVAGDRVKIVGVVPEGQNSHEFEPPPSVARSLADADLVLLNGLHLEEPTLRLARATVRDDVRVVELGRRAITRDEWIFDFSFPEANGNPNPHVWTSPRLGKRMAELARDELVRLDSAGSEVYDRNLRAFADRIDELDRAVRVASATVPAGQRKLLTYHDSFPYFACDYGWTIVGAVQPSDFSEPSPRDVADLIEQIRRERVPAIFGSEVFPSPVLERIGREAGVRYVDTLRDDDLPGRPGDPEHSWIGLLKADFVSMIRALGGDPRAVEAVDAGAVVADRARYPQ
jgi:ABC-type Zn uptake system ZnuABC Zn-binding protein ZnuA